MEQIRTFIAIGLPDKVKKELANIESVLKSGNTTPVKWVDPDSIHLTLKFLGDIDADRISEVLDYLREASTDISPFTLKIEGLGVFPNPKRTQIVWAGLDGDMSELGRLQQNIETGMDKLGFKRENRKFSPHLTLGRVRNQATPAERERLGTVVTGTPFSTGFINVDSINLMKSRLTRQGAIYTRLDSISLK